jgi:NADH-quinone oxidoreductase subunit G
MKDADKFASVLKSSKKPIVILGASSLRRADGLEVHKHFMNFAQENNVVREDWNGFNLLHTAASKVGALELKCTSNKNLDEILNSDVVYLMGADEIDPKRIGKNSFVIYHGHHITNAASNADVILPASAYTEKSAIYVNNEGRAQLANKASKPFGSSVDGWEIVCMVAKALNKPLPFSTLSEVRNALEVANPIFKNLGKVLPATWHAPAKTGKISDEKIASKIDSFYLTNSIARASTTMHKCAKELVNK